MSGAVMLQVVLVDDDRLFREALAAGLRREGFDVTAHAGGPAAIAALTLNDAWRAIDVIVLDWRMPEMEGPQVLERLRGEGVTTPVVMLTSLSDQVYEEAALGFGAVDFVDKERSVSILARRLRIAGSQGPRAAASEESEGIITVDALTLDLSARRARWREKEVDLTLTEFDMVAQMAQRAGRDVTYRELYDLVHGQGFQSGTGSEGFRSNVRGFIKRIRRKFEIVDPGFEAIENYPGFGYRWRAHGSP